MINPGKELTKWMRVASVLVFLFTPLSRLHAQTQAAAGKEDASGLAGQITYITIEAKNKYYHFLMDSTSADYAAFSSIHPSWIESITILQPKSDQNLKPGLIMTIKANKFRKLPAEFRRKFVDNPVKK